MTPEDLFGAMERLTLEEQNRELRRGRAVARVVRQGFLMKQPEDLAGAIEALRDELRKVGLTLPAWGCFHRRYAGAAADPRRRGDAHPVRRRDFRRLPAVRRFSEPREPDPRAPGNADPPHPVREDGGPRPAGRRRRS